jgi:pyruvate/2-oxoglutarate dehydrogenase complex dihydrolipoamide dehydrogenase (E3) component
MDRFDLVIIGAGPAGEAAAYKARSLGASVAIVDRDLFGGACPFFACMPSKSLLHSAAVHAAGGDYPWPEASLRRDWMISRQGIDYPEDTRHFEKLRKVGAVAMRGSARLDGPGRIVITHDQVEHRLEAGAVILAVGSTSKVPDLPGLADIPYWTNRDATTARELPESLVVLGAGPTGVELSQAYARYGVPVTLVVPSARILPRDHERSSAAVAKGLQRDGVTIRTGVRAVAAHAAAGEKGRHRLDLDDASSVEGAAVLLAIGRDLPLADLGLDSVGVDVSSGKPQPDRQLRIAPGLFVAGDPAGPEMHTHVSHYEGEITARIALGEDVTPDFSGIPRAVYTDPESASVGLLLEQARERGIRAEELSSDLATTAKGEVAEAEGHVTIVVDRGAGTLAGVFMAGPSVSEAIHEAVLAVKLQTPLSVLADTIHAFPTVARVMALLFADAVKKLP